MSALEKLLHQNNEYLTISTNDRVRCKLTGHEMPSNYEIIQKYLESKTFKKAKEWYSKDYSAYLPHIVPHKSGDPKKLFCKLTKKTLNKIPHEIEKHVHGKKYIRLKEEFSNKQELPIPEDDQESDIWKPDEDIDSVDESEDSQDDKDYDSNEEQELIEPPEFSKKIIHQKKRIINSSQARNEQYANSKKPKIEKGNDVSSHRNQENTIVKDLIASNKLKKLDKSNKIDSKSGKSKRNK